MLVKALADLQSGLFYACNSASHQTFNDASIPSRLHPIMARRPDVPHVQPAEAVMSGDWIKIEVDLPEKPEVWQIAGIVGIDADSVVGKLLKVWRWFDAHTEDGNAVGVTYPLVDHVSGVSGFAEAMALCGWLEKDGNIMRLPHFDRHNGKTAKNRAVTAKRVAKFKLKSNEEGNANIVTEALPREEKRREDQKTAPKADFLQGIPDQVAKDFQQLRHRLRAPITATVMAGIAREAKKAGVSVADALTICCERSWRGFKADWLDDANGSKPSNGSTPDYMVGAL